MNKFVIKCTNKTSASRSFSTLAGRCRGSVVCS